ncbi:MAG: sigma-70 family RNA polymerase sigma factor [Planctomycetota bacterium]
MIPKKSRTKSESGTPETASNSPEELLRAYQPLVRGIAERLRGALPSWVELGDLIQSGQIGLLQAIQRYSQDRNVAFSTYGTCQRL